MAGVHSMNTTIPLLSRAEDYLAERRRLGYALRSSGYAIKSFARYVDDVGHEGPLTAELMATWARRISGSMASLEFMRLILLRNRRVRRWI